MVIVEHMTPSTIYKHVTEDGSQHQEPIGAVIAFALDLSTLSCLKKNKTQFAQLAKSYGCFVSATDVSHKTKPNSGSNDKGSYVRETNVAEKSLWCILIAYLMSA